MTAFPVSHSATPVSHTAKTAASHAAAAAQPGNTIDTLAPPKVRGTDKSPALTVPVLSSIVVELRAFVAKQIGLPEAGPIQIRHVAPKSTYHEMLDALLASSKCSRDEIKDARSAVKKLMLSKSLTNIAKVTYRADQNAIVADRRGLEQLNYDSVRVALLSSVVGASVLHAVPTFKDELQTLLDNYIRAVSRHGVKSGAAKEAVEKYRLAASLFGGYIHHHCNRLGKRYFPAGKAASANIFRQLGLLFQSSPRAMIMGMAKASSLLGEYDRKPHVYSGDLPMDLFKSAEKREHYLGHLRSISESVSLERLEESTARLQNTLAQLRA